MRRAASWHPCPPSTESAKKIVSFVVNNDEGGEIDHLDPPYRFHPELGIFDDLNFTDTVLGEARGATTDRAEIKAAMPAAGRANFGAPVTLG
jgi:hypothetical protein